ncbi:saxitoxin and tetrodotoxin-binding protein 1-like [Aplochiton taeniatus]
MGSLYKTVLAVLLVASGTTAAPTDEECADLVKPLAAPELNTISGSWILVHGYTDHPFYDERLKNTTSAQMEIVKTDDGKTVTFNQGDMLGETCISYSLTLQGTDNTLQKISKSNPLRMARCVHVYDWLFVFIAL